MEIELADAVASVRDELLEAASQSAGAGVEFVTGPAELEFAVELRRDAKANAVVVATCSSQGRRTGGRVRAMYQGRSVADRRGCRALWGTI
ncbi:trypco2 family protein [Amycolatopsis echigonensis]|uniref:trypco2 family protein n=1 Tax=Amycolatopsis echigonensis TaxID=2576905 RepID=UPI001FE681DF|nr:trypco2 family protein [Amycolatopsis echigonensis]